MKRTIALAASRLAPSRPKPDAASPPSAAGKPERWWQWILLYPTLGISLLTAAPQWVDQARAAVQGINQASARDAEKQSMLWRRNLSCAAAPFAWYSNPSNVRVDATICDSGDIFVRAATPANGQFFKWIAIEDVVQAPAEAGNPIIPAAHAARLDLGAMAGSVERKRGAARGAQYAQSQAMVICQRFIDQRMLVRRVQTPQGCFDEIVDTFNGQVVRRNQVPCAPQC